MSASRRALAQLKNITSDLIGRFAWSVENATRDTYGDGPLTRYSANVVIPEETSYEIVALKGIAVYFVMAPREHEPFHQEERQIINDLIDVLMADSPRPSSALEAVLLQDWDEATNDGERLRVAVDQVASLTDSSGPCVAFDPVTAAAASGTADVRLVGYGWNDSEGRRGEGARRRGPVRHRVRERDAAAFRHRHVRRPVPVP